MWSINRHFKAEALLLLALALVPLALSLLAWLVLSALAWLDEDRCLDAGGRYESAEGRCIMRETP